MFTALNKGVRPNALAALLAGFKTVRRWWSQMFYMKKVWFLNTVELPCNGTSRDRRKSAAGGELTSQPYYNKLFLKWRFSRRQEPGKAYKCLWLGLPLTVSCFREYSDKKNTNKNLKSLAVVFACNTERAYNITVLHYVLAKQSLCFVCAVLEAALSNTCFEFCQIIFHPGLLLLLLDILLTAPPSLGQIDDSCNNPQKFLLQYIIVKHVTISSDSLMSLLRHTDGSTIPRFNCVTFGHKRFVWRFQTRA